MMPSDVTPVHTAVRGRVRFRVAGLRDEPSLARTIERGLMLFPGVTQASASSRTGNVLVLHDEDTAVHGLAGHIDALRRGEVQLDREDESAAHQWHAMEPAEVAEAVCTSPLKGLSPQEAQQRLESDGPNAIPRTAGRTDWSILMEQFQGLPVAMLAGAAVLSLATGGLLEAGAILAVVGLNAAIGFGVEKRTEQTISQLGAPCTRSAQLIRDGMEIEVPTQNIVRGDMIVLQRGSVVPADGRLLCADALTVSEAALTGESQPVAKSEGLLAESAAALGDRSNMVYRGTIVTGGSGRAVVVATGRHTEMGRIQQLVGISTSPETPSLRQMRELGRQLFWATAAATGVIFGAGLLRGLSLLQLVRSSLAVAVAAVPEGLPMVATTTLALGVENMRRRGILVRRLDAIETLAAANVICFDKTGTLTHGAMSLDSVAIGDHVWRSSDGVWTDRGGEYAGKSDMRRLQRLLSIASLCSDAEVRDARQRFEARRSSTEVALIEGALAMGIDVTQLRRDHPRYSVQRRTEAYRFMVTCHHAPRGFLIAMKGSPADVLARCRWELSPNGRRRRLTPERKNAIEGINQQLAEKGLRVLGVAFFEGRKSRGSGELDPAEVADLVWLGLAALSDPLRSDVRDLMPQLHRAGIHTVMLTGDQRRTAYTIASEVGLSGDAPIEVIDAVELDRLDTAELVRAARRAHAFARITPTQKLRIVQSLQHAGAVVAMVGDGINDSPALRAANVGIAIGRNEESAAREVADIFFANDQLGMLPVAVACGRSTYVNVRKAVHYILSTNTSEVLTVLASTAAGAGEILSPVQLLWINLVSDVFPGIGLAMGEPDPRVLDRAPHAADEPILKTSDFGRLAREAGLITAGSFGAGLIGATRYGIASPQARTMTFGSLVTGQLLHALTYADRGNGGPMPSNAALLGIVGGSLLLQGLAMFVPGLRSILGVAPIGALDLTAMIAGGVLPYLGNRALAEAGTASAYQAQGRDLAAGVRMDSDAARPTDPAERLLQRTAVHTLGGGEASRRLRPAHPSRSAARRASLTR
ncbi:HAD-IC family P-type ATPase [Bradyrhizobium sp. STM 3562]|uniref:cation-translocating P-type ATPase n=1 Tax=Bradyrhizobium sp. STM 3562 TaxID=578924 RepID=UPI00388E19EF